MKNFCFEMIFIFVFLFFTSCHLGKEVKNNNEILEKGFIATITCDPLDSFTLFFALQNLTDDPINIGLRIGYGDDITVYWPDGTKKHQLAKGGGGGQIRRLQPEEKYVYPSWLFAYLIITHPIVKRKNLNDFPTGLYKIIWKNERLDFEVSYDYHFDYHKVSHRL